MIYEPTRPSDKTPQVEVSAGKVTMKFWMPAGTPSNLSDLRSALKGLPRRHSWHIYAVTPRKNGLSKGNVVKRWHFILQIEGNNSCTDDEFERAFETFCEEIYAVVGLG